MNNKTIQTTIKSRTGIKWNYIAIGHNSAEMYITRNNEQGMSFNLGEVKSYIVSGDFENFITVSLAGENNNHGPDVKPSKKALNRLARLINGTNYKIVQQNGQNFTLEGEN